MSVETTTETKVEETVKVPTSFKDLKAKELKAAALAFGVDETQGADGIRAELLENGVTWEMYEEAFKVKPETVEVEESTVITSKDVNPPREGVDEVTITTPEIITAEEAAPLAASSKYLIKMDRKNPSFEFRRYKFTQENPYAVMDADDAQAILSKEDGFRQAFPNELQEYYS